MIKYHCECGRPYPIEVVARMPKEPKTHCPQGHERTPENIHPVTKSCLVCHRLKMQARNQVHREAARKRGITIAEYHKRYGGSMDAAAAILGSDRIYTIFREAELPRPLMKG